MRTSQRQAVVAVTLTLTALVSMVSLGVALYHWHAALNTCTMADCGCLLYAKANSNLYAITGSDVSICYFSALAPLPGCVVALCFALFYGYRGFIRRPRKRRDLHLNRRTALLTVQAMVCGVLGLVAVVHVSLLTDGYYATCHEYRKAVMKTLSASGSLALLVNERLSCPVIYDFLDYMKPDAREFFFGPQHWFPGEGKLTTINTAAALVISLICSWANMLLWLGYTAYSGALARRMSQRAKQNRLARQALHITDL